MPSPSSRTPRPSEETAALREEVEALRRQVVELQRVSALGVLAGSVCHELNNALMPVLNYAKLGKRSKDDAYRDRSFQKILEGAQRATAIAGGILGLARPRADRKSVTDLVRLTDEVLMLVAKDLQSHRIALDYEAEGRPHSPTNPAEIQQVLLNLVINARQAMPEGGTLKVRVRRDRTGKRAEVSVADSGVGIAPGDLRRIFEPFFTTKNGPDASGLGGTGLGLPVCREIVEAHQGRLRAESRPGLGSTFTLILPICPEAATSQGAA